MGGATVDELEHELKVSVGERKINQRRELGRAASREGDVKCAVIPIYREAYASALAISMAAIRNLFSLAGLKLG